jgi:hypothetical protein
MRNGTVATQPREMLLGFSFRVESHTPTMKPVGSRSAHFDG